jgi:hypothetical protein
VYHPSILIPINFIEILSQYRIAILEVGDAN